jgi:hypothetical protein
VSAILLGLLGGTAFGVVAVLLMLPLSFPDKKRALTAAFFSRFAIGFLIPSCAMPWPMPVTGALVGLLVSLPDAVITKAYAPVIATGVAGGLLLGWIAGP